MPATWTINYNGVTKSAADWGVRNLKRAAKHATTGKVTFTIDGQAVDAAPVFPQARNAVLTITAVNNVAGVTRFTIPNHLYFTGLGCRLSAPVTGTALPGGLAAGTLYYLQVIDQNTVALAPTQADALAGTGLILCGSAGTVPLCIRVTNLLTVLKDGVGWFVGVVTKIPGKASPHAEAQDYEISDPWHFFEQTVFQQMWVTTNLAGGATTTLTTAQSSVILSQALNGVKMDLSQVFNEVMTYMTYALAGVPFPSTINATTLTADALDDPYAPFQIGTLPPDLTVPYNQVKDKTCAEVLKILLKFLPDVIQSFDFTTTPPTLNFAARSAMAAKTIAVLDGTVTSGFNPTRRDDLLVPLVIAKYEQAITVDGLSTSHLSVDAYPPLVAENTPGALINTVDLLGGHATYQKQTVKVTDRPITADDVNAFPWLKRKLPWLFAYNTPGDVSSGTVYDIANISVAAIATVLDQADPYATDPSSAPAGFTVDACTEELLPGGNVTPWMTENDGVFAAKLVMTVQLNYAGTDPATLALFTNNPAVANSRLDYPAFVGTNASSKTYQELTSFQQSEPVPVGLAQSLYTTLSALHFDGALELTEQEVSGRLPIGYVFNTTDGNAEWQAMNALILAVEEDVDQGKTKVTFGPTLSLGLDDLVELLRAQRGALFAWQLNQRTTGVSGAENAVIGHSHSADNSASAAAPGGVAALTPYSGYDASAGGATPQVGTTAGTHGGVPPASLAPIPVGVGTGIVYVQCDFTYDGSNNITIVGVSLHTSGGTTAPASSISSSGPGAGGSGTIYQPLYGYTATVTAGKAKVSIAQYVGGSQNFGVCVDAITGPWGV